MNINTLPDLCMVIIFSRVPLHDCLRTGHVCTKWRWIRSIVTAKRRSLTILVGKDAFDLIESSALDYPSSFSEHLLNDDGTPMFGPKILGCELQLNSLETKSVVELANLFPNVRQLTLAMKATDSCQLLVVAFLFELLNGDKLISLKLFFELKALVHINFIPQLISRQLFASINSMYSLKHLTLEFNANFTMPLYQDLPRNFVPSDETTSVDLSIISRLDEFNFYSIGGLYDDERGDIVMFDSFVRHAKTQNANPVRIQCGYYHLSEHLSKLDQFDPQFCLRFTHLAIPISPSRLINICTRFNSITIGHFEVSFRTFGHILTNLSQLTQLMHLKLNIWFSTITFNESSDDLPQLLSVKSLDLHISDITDHNNISLLNLPWTFPNIQVMGLYMFTNMGRCTICGYDERDDEIEVNREDILEHCFQQLAIPLRQCTRLHTVTKFDVPPFEAAKLPLTKQDLMHTIELEYVGNLFL